MMKTKASLLFVAFSITACSTDNEPMNEVGNPAAARVTAGIGGVVSRAVGNQWEEGDCIGISGTSGTKTYANMQYRTSGNGKFTHVGGDATGIFLHTPGAATFSAYYPFTGNENNDAGVISDVSTEEQSNRTDFDFMFASATASAASPQLSFTGDASFKHCMSRLVLKIKTDTGSGFNASDVTKGTYSISGIKHSGTFNTATGEAVATGNATDNWEITAPAADADNVRTYDMILFPQSGAEIKLKATFDDETYACTFIPTLAGGYSYIYEITISTPELIVNGCTIEPWGDGPVYGGNATAAPPIGDKALSDVQIGDYYFSDGTFADKDDYLLAEASAECIGIVFYVGQHDSDDSDYSMSGIGQPKCHGYVVALTDVGYLSWGPYGEISGVSTNDTDWRGYANQKKLEENIDNYPAAKGCRDYGKDNGGKYAAPVCSSGWFLPSCGQLRHLYSNRTLLSGQMDKCKEKSVDANIGWPPGIKYWSSSEYNARIARWVAMDDGFVGFEPSNYPEFVRAILAF